jgi:hypothetical protein
MPAGRFAIAMVNALFVLGFFLSREQPKELLRRIGPELLKEFFNGCVYAQTVLAPCALILFPVLVAVIVSYVFAGELEIGHMRMTLVRPPSRVKILLAKWCAVALYTGLMLLALLCVSYLFALVLMKPSGDLIVIGDAFGIHKKFILHPAGMEAWGRVALSYALACRPALHELHAFLFASFRELALSAILGSDRTLQLRGRELPFPRDPPLTATCYNPLEVRPHRTLPLARYARRRVDRSLLAGLPRAGAALFEAETSSARKTRASRRQAKRDARAALPGSVGPHSTP